jgi:hypothetical protein
VLENEDDRVTRKRVQNERSGENGIDSFRLRERSAAIQTKKRTPLYTGKKISAYNKKYSIHKKTFSQFERVVRGETFVSPLDFSSASPPKGFWVD